jgi:hypothetical protein
MALAELKFIDRAEVLHLIGPPGTGKSHLSVALGVEAIKAARSVYFTTLANSEAHNYQQHRPGISKERPQASNDWGSTRLRSVQGIIPVARSCCSDPTRWVRHYDCS